MHMVPNFQYLSTPYELSRAGRGQEVVLVQGLPLPFEIRVFFLTTGGECNLRPSQADFWKTLGPRNVPPPWGGGGGLLDPTNPPSHPTRSPKSRKGQMLSSGAFGTNPPNPKMSWRGGGVGHPPTQNF